MTDNSNSPLIPKTRFVSHLPDLIEEDDYLECNEQKKIRLQIDMTDDGVEILGDSMSAHLVEELFAQLGAEEIERMLCG